MFERLECMLVCLLVIAIDCLCERVFPQFNVENHMRAVFPLIYLSLFGMNRYTCSPDRLSPISNAYFYASFYVL